MAIFNSYVKLPEGILNDEILSPPTFIEIPTAWWWNQRQVHPSHVLMHSSAFFTWGQLPMVIFRSYGTHHGTWCTKIVMFHEQLLVILVLVGGFNPSEKYEFVSWDDYSQYIYIWKHKTCSKPPTRMLVNGWLFIVFTFCSHTPSLFLDLQLGMKSHHWTYCRWR